MWKDVDCSRQFRPPDIGKSRLHLTDWLSVLLWHSVCLSVLDPAISWHWEGTTGFPQFRWKSTINSGETKQKYLKIKSNTRWERKLNKEMIIWYPSALSDKQSSSGHSLATGLSCLTLIGCSAQHRCNHKLVSLPISLLLYLPPPAFYSVGVTL